MFQDEEGEKEHSSIELIDLKEAIADEPDRDEVAPLFLFLASSLNVELVYIILKGIT